MISLIFCQADADADASVTPCQEDAAFIFRPLTPLNIFRAALRADVGLMLMPVDDFMPFQI